MSYFVSFLFVVLNHLGFPRGHRSTGQDQSTGAQPSRRGTRTGNPGAGRRTRGAHRPGQRHSCRGEGGEGG